MATLRKLVLIGLSIPLFAACSGQMEETRSDATGETEGALRGANATDGETSGADGVTAKAVTDELSLEAVPTATACPGGVSEVEPNDTVAQASPLGPVTCGTITPGDVDNFSFVLPKNATRLALSYTATTRLTFTVTVRNVTFTAFGPGAPSLPLYPGEKYVLTAHSVAGAAAGTYRIQQTVSTSAPPTPPPPPPGAACQGGASETEPNGTPAQANTLGAAVCGSISPTDVDVFKFVLPANAKQLGFSFSATAAVRFTLTYGNTTQPILSAGAPSIPFHPGGTYYITVRGSTAGAYRLMKTVSL